MLSMFQKKTKQQCQDDIIHCKSKCFAIHPNEQKRQDKTEVKAYPSMFILYMYLYNIRKMCCNAKWLQK